MLTELDNLLGGPGYSVIYSAYVLIALGTFILVQRLMQEDESRAAEDNLKTGGAKSSNPLVKVTRPFFSNYIVPYVRNKPFWRDRFKIYRRRLISAGLGEELTPEEFIAFKFFNILFFPLVAGFLKANEFLDLPLYMILGSGALGWFYPDLWVNGRRAARQKLVLRSMPFVVDLLALSTEAGMDFVGAIGKVVEKSNPSPFIEELAQVLKELKVGATRADALREMALRIDLTEMNSFVAILISSAEMGAPIGKILRQQSEQIRVQRMLLAEKAGAAAAQKLLMPIVLLVLPALMLMIFGPIGLSMFAGG